MDNGPKMSEDQWTLVISQIELIVLKDTAVLSTFLSQVNPEPVGTFFLYF